MGVKYVFYGTIHKCQGLSLNCALMDLSDCIFSPGMAYVALSRVRTLNGVHLLAFDPNSITVSRGCLQEINRLRLFRSDLPAYTLPALKKCTSTRKRKLTGTASLRIEPESEKVKASPAQSKKATGKRCSTVQSRKTMGKRPSTVQSSKATGKRPSTDDSVKEMKKPCAHVDPSSDCLLLSSNLTFTNDGQIQLGTEWPMLQFNPVNVLWQQETCARLSLQYRHPNRFGIGGPDQILTLPRGTRNVLGDGNCLFWSFALIITGSQQDHLLVRFAILSHKISIGHFLRQHHMSSNHTSVQNYIQSTRMDRDGTWDSEVEIFTLSHMLGTNIYSFHVGHSNWSRFSPANVDRSLSTDVGGMSMYIKHRYNHFLVVSSVATPDEAV